MAEEDHEVHVGFTADLEELKGKLHEAGKYLHETFESLENTFGSLGKAFGALAGILAGTEAFEKAIEVTSELVDKTREFMDVTGEAADEAQAIDTAMKMAGGTAEQYEQTLRRLEMRMNMNREVFERYGIETRDASGHLLDAKEVMQNTLKVLSDMEVGTNRNTAGLQLMGRGAGDVSALLRAMKVNTEEVAETQAKLGLTVTDATIAMRDDYRTAVVEVNEVFEALWNRIGSALMPVLTQLAKWFAEKGPEAVELMNASIEVFESVWEIMWGGVSEIVASFSKALGELTDDLVDTFGEDGKPATGLKWWIVMMRTVEVGLLELKYGFQNLGITAAWAGEQASIEFEAMAEAIKHPIDALRGVDKTLNVLNDRISANKENWIEAAKAAMKAMEEQKAAIVAGEKAAPEPAKPHSGTRRAIDKPDPGAANAQLAVDKAAEDAKAAMIKEYVAEDQAILDRSYALGLLSDQSYYAQKTALEQRAMDASIDAKQKELAATQAAEAVAPKEAQRLQLKAKAITLEGELAVLEAQRANAAVKNDAAMLDAQQKLYDNLDQNTIDRAKQREDSEISIETDKLNTLKSLREVSAQDAFKIQQDLEERSYQAAVNALNAQRALIRGNDDAQAQARAALDKQMEAAAQQHQQKLTQISNQAEVDRMQFAVAAETSINGGFETLFESLAHNIHSVGTAVRALGQTIADTFIKLIAQNLVERLFGAGQSLLGPIIGSITKMVSSWLGGQSAMTASQAAGSSARVAQVGTESAVSSAANATALAEQQTLGVSSVLSNAAIAAVAAMASVAEIPVVGWAMAPEVGAATYAEGLAYLPSAAQGWWQVPGDTLAQIHKDEMVMPAPLAERAREVIEGGGGGGGGGMHLHATPLKGGFWVVHQDDLVKAYDSAHKARRTKS